MVREGIFQDKMNMKTLNLEINQFLKLKVPVVQTVEKIFFKINHV